MLLKEQIPWLWYMTWSGEFALTENCNSFAALEQLYHHDYATTLDKLITHYKKHQNSADNSAEPHHLR